MFIFANIIDAIATVGHMLISLYSLVVIAACAVSWFHISPYNQVVQTLYRLTDPVFSWVRRRLPFTCQGSLDLSPIAVLVALELFDLIVIRSIRQFAVGF